MTQILRGPVTIAPDSTWTDAATTWPVYVDMRETADRVWRASDYGTRKTFRTETELHLRCGTCGQSVLCLSPSVRDESYRVAVADMLAGILAHLRRSHPHVVES